MATDFAITIDGAAGAMSFDERTDLMNNVYLSLMTRRGSFFQDLNFGSRLHLLQRAKNTERTAALARSYCKEALQWLVDTGRALAVAVATEIDKRQNLDRMMLLVEVTQADGQLVSFSFFHEVV